MDTELLQCHTNILMLFASCKSATQKNMNIDSNNVLGFLMDCDENSLVSK